MRGESTAQPRGTGAAAHNDMTSRDPPQHSAHRSVESTSNRSAVVGALIPNTDIDTGTQPSLDWAAIATVPPPVVIRNRFSALTSTDDERDAESFSEYHSRRSLKRMRQSSQQLQSTTYSQPQHSEEQSRVHKQSIGQQRRRGNRLIKGSSSAVIQGLSAATELVNKSVFCIDNLHPRVDVQQLSNFVRKLGVKVLSCYQIKPRRQRNEVEPIVDRAAFRLCIDSAYREQLLVSGQWPHSVTISDWYYIKPGTDRGQQVHEQRSNSRSVSIADHLRADDTSTVVKLVDAASAAAVVSPQRLTTSTPRDSATAATAATADMDLESMDTTLTYSHAESTACDKDTEATCADVNVNDG